MRDIKNICSKAYSATFSPEADKKAFGDFVIPFLDAQRNVTELSKNTTKFGDEYTRNLNPEEDIKKFKISKISDITLNDMIQLLKSLNTNNRKYFMYGVLLVNDKKQILNVFTPFGFKRVLEEYKTDKSKYTMFVYSVNTDDETEHIYDNYNPKGVEEIEEICQEVTNRRIDLKAKITCKIPDGLTDISINTILNRNNELMRTDKTKKIINFNIFVEASKIVFSNIIFPYYCYNTTNHICKYADNGILNQIIKRKTNYTVGARHWNISQDAICVGNNNYNMLKNFTFLRRMATVNLNNRLVSYDYNEYSYYNPFPLIIGYSFSKYYIEKYKLINNINEKDLF
ncbi:MAG: hypothetical protein LBD17_04100 [Endomicrobium sp.]|nr:hypothetical protein [Endomicrobium sp.]